MYSYFKVVTEENNKMKREIKILEDKNFDLELENAVLKKNLLSSKQLGNEDDSLLDLPLQSGNSDKIKNYDEERTSCFWRFGTFFKNKN